VFTLSRYRALFAVPGLKAAFVASVVGRLPIGVAGLAILLYVQTRSHSFAQAGVASALYVLGLAAVAPALGRLIDRLGPRPIMLACSAVYPAALALLIFAVERSAHGAWIAASAFVAGAALPPVSICMRALFPRVVHDPLLLPTAYSLDSALVEFIFIVGPALVAACVAAGFPAVAVAAAAVCAAAGGAIFVRADMVRAWRPAARRSERRRGPLQRPQLVLVFVITLCYSVAFGLFEVAVTAFAAGKGQPAVAGVALAMASVGSAAGALTYGSRHWGTPLPRQFLLALVGMAACILLMTPLDNVALFVAIAVIAGVPMATVISIQSLLVSRLTPREMLAESFTWGTTCLLGGISAGLAAGGLLVERIAPGGTMATAAAITALGAALTPLLRGGATRDS
jgi:MFS family permease